MGIKWDIEHKTLHSGLSQGCGSSKTPPSFCIFSMKITKLAATFAWLGLGDFSPMPGKSRHGIYVGPSLVQTNGLFLNFSHQNFWRLPSLPLGLGLWLVEVRKNHKNNKILFQNCSMTFDYAQGPKWCCGCSHGLSYLCRGDDDLLFGIFLASLRKWFPKSTTL